MSDLKLSEWLWEPGRTVEGRSISEAVRKMIVNVSYPGSNVIKKVRNDGGLSGPEVLAIVHFVNINIKEAASLVRMSHKLTHSRKLVVLCVDDSKRFSPVAT